MGTENLTGAIVTGLGRAAGFTEIHWAKVAFSELLGCNPFPGTVNVILSSEKGTGAITRVHIESTDNSKRHWTTIGVSSNIIDASYNAIYDSITYKLFNDLNK